MDWLRKVPIGQYVAGEAGWLRSIDPRLKLAWVLMFLLTPVLAEISWRIGLVLILVVITFCSGLPLRTWWRSLLLLCLLAISVGLLAMLLPTSDSFTALSLRSPYELRDINLASPSWEIFSFGPLNIDRRSAELGIKTSTLIFTVIHSVNLMLITTSPENLVWALRWFLQPLAFLKLPLDKLSFQLLLALRFLPLVQEELQNLLRSIATRNVNFRKLGFKSALDLILSVGERLLANILLRAEQGADSLLSRNRLWISPDDFRPERIANVQTSLINIGSILILVLCLVLRFKYGT